MSELFGGYRTSFNDDSWVGFYNQYDESYKFYNMHDDFKWLKQNKLLQLHEKINKFFDEVIT